MNRSARTAAIFGGALVVVSLIGLGGLVWAAFGEFSDADREGSIQLLARRDPQPGDLEFMSAAFGEDPSLAVNFIEIAVSEGSTCNDITISEALSWLDPSSIDEESSERLLLASESNPDCSIDVREALLDRLG